MITVLVDMTRSTVEERTFFYSLDGVGPAMDALSQLRNLNQGAQAVRLEVLNTTPGPAGELED